MVAIGPLEAILVFAVACMALMLRLWHQRASRWGMAVAGCLAVAAIFTPPDPYSMTLAGMLLLGVFVAGVVAAPFLGVHNAPTSSDQNRHWQGRPLAEQVPIVASADDNPYRSPEAF
jgi:Sec-independent protein secretion pathway component TatC